MHSDTAIVARTQPLSVTHFHCNVRKLQLFCSTLKQQAAEAGVKVHAVSRLRLLVKCKRKITVTYALGLGRGRQAVAQRCQIIVARYTLQTLCCTVCIFRLLSVFAARQQTVDCAMIVLLSISGVDRQTLRPSLHPDIYALRVSAIFFF